MKRKSKHATGRKPRKIKERSKTNFQKKKQKMQTCLNRIKQNNGHR